jgi:hypothetical protein
VTAVKRYQVFHTAMTTGMQLLRAHSDTPKEAHHAARVLQESGERGVEIVDTQSGTSYTLQSFGAAHKLR